eukprot:1310457-Amphidinium_carterae.2
MQKLVVELLAKLLHGWLWSSRQNCEVRLECPACPSCVCPLQEHTGLQLQATLCVGIALASASLGASCAICLWSRKTHPTQSRTVPDGEPTEES